MNSPVTLRPVEEPTVFEVGDRVRDDEHVKGGIGVVIETEHEHFSQTFKILVDYGKGYGTKVYTKEGAYNLVDKPSLIKLPKEEPKRVLTEWQMGKIGSIIHQYACDDYNMKGALIAIDEILSEPEPAKYQPKENEPVLVREGDTEVWVARVFKEMKGLRYATYHIDGIPFTWNYAIPFDPSKVGTVTE